MKNGLLLILVILAFNGISQVEITNESLTIPTEKIAYKAFNNELQLNFTPNESTYIVNRGVKLVRYDAIFSFIPMLPIDSDTLSIFHDGKQIREVVFRIEELQAPKVVFGDVKDDKITFNQLLENPGLHVTYEPQLAIPNYYVAACELLIDTGKKKPKQVIIQGNAFSPKQLKMIANLKPGTIIDFNNGLLTNMLGELQEKPFNLKFTIQ